MKLLIFSLTIVTVSSQISYWTYASGDIIHSEGPTWNYSIHQVSQIYNTNLVAFCDFTNFGPAAHHYGHFSIYDVEKNQFVKSPSGSDYAQLKDNMGNTEYALPDYMVNLPNSKYISVQVNWSEKFYVKTFNTQLEEISVIDNTGKFFPGNNGNLIFIPKGNTLLFYNVVSGESYNQITSELTSTITYACEISNYYLIAIDNEIEFYNLSNLQKESSYQHSNLTPLQIKPYHIMNDSTFITTYNFYALWEDSSTKMKYITNLNSDLDFQDVFQIQSNFLSCAPGNLNNLELVCTTDSNIVYTQNNQEYLTIAQPTHFRRINLEYMSNSTFYGSSYYGVTYYTFYDSFILILFLFILSGSIKNN